MTGRDEQTDTGYDFLDLPDFPDDAEVDAPVEGWLSALGQMAAALLVVVGTVALFIGLAVVLRWLLP
jgi:hypothetical protein